MAFKAHQTCQRENSYTKFSSGINIRGSVTVQALRHKTEGREFESRCGNLNKNKLRDP
jgi:hypothetical protein